MLNFIGSGSAFNTELGNTSAFFKQDDTLLLFDCGSTIFSSLIRKGVLEGVNDIKVFITHTHPDHVGSLGDLIFYSYYIMGTPGECCIEVYSPVKLDGLLHRQGIRYGHVELIHVPANIHKVEGHDIIFRTVPTNHVDELYSVSYDISIGSYRLFYSGDTKEVPELIAATIRGFTEFDFIYKAVYIDTCSTDFEGNPHLTLDKLAEGVPEDYREFFHCMHLDTAFDYEKAVKLGFNVVHNYKKEDKQ